MAAVSFADLPDDARVWVFAASEPLHGDRAQSLLAPVDEFLAQWQAHGLALTCARDWREDRFLAIAVDQRDAHASGCSIDGLYRVFKELERTLGTSLLGGGRVFYRLADGTIACVSRADFIARAADGRVAPATPVFDTSVTTAADYRERFERAASAGWHGELLPH